MIFKGKKKHLKEAEMFLKTIVGQDKTAKQVDKILSSMPLVHKHFREICRGEKLIAI